MDINDFKDIYLFKELSESEIDQFLKSGERIAYKTDAPIFSEGTVGDALYLIISGAVKITKQIEENHRETLSILKNRDYFGEMALIDSESRSATATAITGTSVYRVTRKQFQSEIKKNPRLGVKLLTCIAKIGSKRLREANNRFSDITKNSKIVRQEVEKMKSGVISLVSHELRTPLAVIKGAAKVLETDNISNENKEKFLEKIERQSNKLTRVVDNLITMSVMQYSKTDIKREDCDLIEIIKYTAKEIMPQAREKDISVKLTAPKSLPIIHADRVGINKVCFNLFDNAVKFTPNNGKVTIKAKVESAHNSSKEIIVISISDTGEGISKSNIDNIFEPFSQQEDHLTRRHGGTGIGLPIVKNIISAHGGDVWVESQEGKGSVFTFTIPV